MESSQPSLKAEFIFSRVATPISYFEQLLKKANPSVFISKEAQNAFQCYVEALIRELIRAAAPVSHYVKRDFINAEDISLVLRCRGTEDLIGLEPLRFEFSRVF